MTTLSDVTKTLQQQNNILEDVSNSINTMLKEQIAERLLSERQRLAAREKEIEARNRSTSSGRSGDGRPANIREGVRRGLLEGLGISGIVGGLGSLIGNMLGGIGFGSLAAAGALSLTRLLTRGAFIGLLANYGKDVIEGLINNLDPEGVYLDRDAQEKFATGLNFSIMGGLLGRTIGGLFGRRFRALFGVAGLVGGFLYPYFENALDDTDLERAFNETFETDFGSEIIAGIGAVVSGVLATVLSTKIIRLVRSTLGLSTVTGGRGTMVEAPGERAAWLRSNPQAMPRTSTTPTATPQSNMSTRQYDDHIRRIQRMGPNNLPSGFTRNRAGAIVREGTNRFASIDDVVAAAEGERLAKIAKAAKYLKVLGAIGLAAEALMIANMIYNGADDEEIIVALSGIIGAAGVGYVGGALGAAGGTMLLPGWGTLAGGLIGGLAGAVGGDWAAESLARMILGYENANTPPNWDQTGGRILQNERDDQTVMSQGVVGRNASGDIVPLNYGDLQSGMGIQGYNMAAQSRARIAAENLARETDAFRRRAANGTVIIDNSTTDNSSTMVGNGSSGPGADYRSSGMDPIDYRMARQYMGIRGYGPGMWNVFDR